MKYKESAKLGRKGSLEGEMRALRLAEKTSVSDSTSQSLGIAEALSAVPKVLRAGLKG